MGQGPWVLEAPRLLSCLPRRKLLSRKNRYIRFLCFTITRGIKANRRNLNLTVHTLFSCMSLSVTRKFWNASQTLGSDGFNKNLIRESCDLLMSVRWRFHGCLLFSSRRHEEIRSQYCVMKHQEYLFPC